MLTKIENHYIGSALSMVFFDDQTLFMALQQAQTVQVPVNYYLILTGNGEIYDDFGEDISLEKIRMAVTNKNHLVQNQLKLSDEELMDTYRNGRSAKYTDTAALIKMQSTESSFNSQKFSVTSCSIFSIKKIEPISSEEPSSKSHKKTSCCLM